MIKKGLLIFIFLSAPAIWLAGYAVYWAKNYFQETWGITIHPLVYSTILIIAVVVAIWATAGKFIKELNTEAERRKKQQRE